MSHHRPTHPPKVPPDPHISCYGMIVPAGGDGLSGCPTVAGLGFGEVASDGPFGEAEAGGDLGRERVTDGTEAAVYSRWHVNLRGRRRGFAMVIDLPWKRGDVASVVWQRVPVTCCSLGTRSYCCPFVGLGFGHYHYWRLCQSGLM